MDTETKTKPIRTQEEIVSRIEEIKDGDFFGFQTGDLIQCLDYDHAKPYLKEDCTKEDWDEDRTEFTRDYIINKMENYMPFAWDKANNCRGISAGRSMDHYTAWMWLIGDDGKLGDLLDYQFYGKDNLVAICNLYGWDHSKWDDGTRTNTDY